MADVLTPSQRSQRSHTRSHARQHGLSVGGAAMAAPLSPSRPSLSSVNTSSSRKASPHRALLSGLEDIPYRIKCGQVLAKDDSDLDRSCRPRKEHSINHGPNNGLRYTTPIIGRGAATGHNTLGAWQGSKSPMPAFPFTRSVTPPQPPVKVSHLNHLSITKTEEPTLDQLLASKSFKDLPAIFTDFPRRIVDENVAARRSEKKGDILSHDSAIPIPPSDLLLRPSYSPTTTASRIVCSRADGHIVEGVIGIDDKNIEILCPWDETDSQPAGDVDMNGKDPSSLRAPETLSSKIQDIDSNAPESVPAFLYRIITEIKAAIWAEDRQVAQRSSTTQPLTDTLESGCNQSTRGGNLRAYGDTSSFGGPAPSQGRGTNPQKRDQNALGVDSSHYLSRKDSSRLLLLCWYAAFGYPCCNGKWYGSTEVRRLMSDHFRAEASPNHHSLHKKCSRCEVLFLDKFSWEEHEKLLKSDRPCRILSASELEVTNHELNRKGITIAHIHDVDEAIDKYKKDRSLPSGCTKGEHDTWVNDNCELYINNSDTKTEVAQLELGKWLVAWYTIFPSKKIPRNPFTKYNAGSLLHQNFRNLVHEGLAKESREGRLPLLNDEQYRIVEEICGDALSESQLREQIDTAPLLKAKRRKPATSGAPRLQPGPTMGSAEPPLPPVYFGQGTGLYPTRHYPTASWSDTLSPSDGVSFVNAASTDHTSFDDVDSVFNVPKVFENEDQTDQGGLGRGPLDLSFLGSQHYGTQLSLQDDSTGSFTGGLGHDGQISPLDNSTNHFAEGIEYLESCVEWDGNSVHDD